MYNNIITILTKLSGFFTAFIYACSYLDLSSLRYRCWVNTEDPYVGLGFILVCLAIVLVGYYIFSDIGKSLGDLYSNLNQKRVDKHQLLTKLQAFAELENRLGQQPIIL